MAIIALVTFLQSYTHDQWKRLDLGVGTYWNVVRPEGAAASILRINIAWIFP